MDKPIKTEQQPDGHASQSKLDTILHEESLTMGRKTHLVRFIETPEGVNLIIYDLEPSEYKGRITYQRRWAVYFDDNPTASGIVEVKSERKQND